MGNSGSRRQITTQTIQEKPSILEMSQSTYKAKSYRGLGLSGNYQKYTAIVNDFENICKLCQFINAESTEADYVYVLAVINNLIDMCDAYKREHGYIWPGVVAQRYEKVETIYKCAIGIHDGLIKKGINLQTSPVTNNQSVQPKSELASSSAPQTSPMLKSSVTLDESLEQQEQIIDTQFTQTSQAQIPVSNGDLEDLFKDENDSTGVPLQPSFTTQLSPIGSATPGLRSPVPSVQPIHLAMPLQDTFVAHPSIQTSKSKLSREEKRQNARKNLIPVCEEERKKYHISADATVSFSDSWEKELKDSQYRIVDTFATSGLKKLFGTLCDELSESCMSRVEECMNSCITDRDINKKLPPAPTLIPEITASIDALSDYKDDGYDYYDTEENDVKIISAKDICAIIAFLEKWKEVLSVVQNYFETAIKSLEPQLRIFADFIDTGEAKDFLLNEGSELITVAECAQLLEQYHIVDAMTLANDEVVDIKSEKCALLMKCLPFFKQIFHWNDTSPPDAHITSVR